jgi:hypothetical protein
MSANPSLIVVTTEQQPIHVVHMSSVHHSHFPEVRGEGSSPETAAARLVDLLRMSLDNAPSAWRRESILGAIEDARAFAAGSR